MYSLKKWQPVLHTQVLGICINLEFQWQEAPAVCDSGAIEYAEQLPSVNITVVQFDVISVK